MNKSLSFESLTVLDAIARRGSFAAAADELDRAPSSLSYQVQKLEQELDIVIFDRSGHKAKFTKAGELILNRGRQIMDAADDLVSDAVALAHGWELDFTLGYDGLIGIQQLFPFAHAFDQATETALHFQEEILAGGWEALMQGRVDMLLAPASSMVPAEVKTVSVGALTMNWVAAPDHPIVKELSPLSPETREKYRIVAASDSATNAAPATRNILGNQSVMRVKSLNDKKEAMKSGLGIGTLVLASIEHELESGELVILGDQPNVTLEIVLGWRRGEMGKAKSWSIENMRRYLALT